MKGGVRLASCRLRAPGAGRRLSLNTLKLISCIHPRESPGERRRDTPSEREHGLSLMLRLVMIELLLLCAPAYGLVSWSSAPRRTAATTRAASVHSSMVSELCALLPSGTCPGEAPGIVGGEMELAEREDSCESRTQIFLHPDGTVTLGQTDGPPPVSMCGLWQCGSVDFQMVLQRTFATERFSTYTVTRVYRGTVNAASTGINVVEGRMGFHDADEQSPAFAGAGSLFDDFDDGLGGTSAVGFFSLDGNTLAELEADQRGF